MSVGKQVNRTVDTLDIDLQAIPFAEYARRPVPGLHGLYSLCGALHEGVAVRGDLRGVPNGDEWARQGEGGEEAGGSEEG